VGISGSSRVGSSSGSSSSSGASSAGAAAAPDSAADEVTQATPPSENNPGATSGSGAALRQRDNANAFRLRSEIAKKPHSSARMKALQRGIAHDLTPLTSAVPVSSRKPPVYPSVAHWLPPGESDAVALQTVWNQIFATQPEAQHFMALLNGLKRLPRGEQAALMEDGMWTLLEHMAKNADFRAQALDMCASHKGAVGNGEGAIGGDLLTYHDLCLACDMHLAVHELRETHMKFPKTLSIHNAEHFENLVERQDMNFNTLIRVGAVSSRLHQVDAAVRDFCHNENLEGQGIVNALRWASRIILDGKTLDTTHGIGLQTGYTTVHDAAMHNQYENEVADLVDEALKAPHEVLRDHLADSPALRQFFETCEHELLAAFAANVRKDYDTACTLRSQQTGVVFNEPQPLRPPHDKEPKVMRHELNMPAFEAALNQALTRLHNLDEPPENPAEMALQQTSEQVARQHMVHQQMRPSAMLKTLEAERQDFLNMGS
jgi:hypothetical protein